MGASGPMRYFLKTPRGGDAGSTDSEVAEFPLFSEGTDPARFAYAMFCLNKVRNSGARVRSKFLVSGRWLGGQFALRSIRGSDVVLCLKVKICICRLGSVGLSVCQGD